MEPKKQSSTFHTDQNRWDYRDFENDEFDRIYNDNKERASIQGSPVEEYESSEALDAYEDSFHVSHFPYHNDTEIERVVKELLHNSDRFDTSDVTVQVTDRTVYLSGTVKSQEARDYIISVVELVHGIGPVESDIIVKLNEGILPTDIGRDSTL